MPVQAVLFDMDGTVIEFTFDFAGARKAVITVLRESGVPDEMLSANLLTYQMLSLGSRYLEDHGEDSSSVLNRAYDELERLDLLSAVDPKPTPGVGNLLDSLMARSVPTMLITNSSERAALAVLQKLNLGGKFSTVVARRQGLRLKPHPDMILEGLSRMSIAPSQQVYFIGDSWADMRAALLAGVSGVGYNRNVSALEGLLVAGATATFSDMKEVKGFLARVLA
jgi:HAD superfamily hydrolase (TIGR01509 family)